MTDGDVVEGLRGAGVGRGFLGALALVPGVGLGMAAATGALSWSCGAEDASVVVGLVEDALRPRWVWWSTETAVPLIRAGVRVATCWDIAAVHRLLFGGWRADPARVWAQLHHLAVGRSRQWRHRTCSTTPPTTATARARPARRLSAAGMGGWRMGSQPGGPCAGPSWPRRSPAFSRRAWLSSRPAEGGRPGPFGVDSRAALRRAVRRRAADGPRRRRGDRRFERGAAPATA